MNLIFTNNPFSSLHYDIFLYHIIPYINDFSIRSVNRDIYDRFTRLSKLRPNLDILRSLLPLHFTTKRKYYWDKGTPLFEGKKHWIRSASNKIATNNDIKLFILWDIFPFYFAASSYIHGNKLLSDYDKVMERFKEFKLVKSFLDNPKQDNIEITLNNRYLSTLLCAYLDRYPVKYNIDKSITYRFKGSRRKIRSKLEFIIKIIKLETQ